MISVILVVILTSLSVYALSQRRKAPLVAWLIFLSSLVGIVLSVFPDLTNDLAQLVGVGRGADLVFYLFIVIALAAIFNLHLQIRRNHEVMTEVIRRLALMSALTPKGGS